MAVDKSKKPASVTSANLAVAVDRAIAVAFAERDLAIRDKIPKRWELVGRVVRPEDLPKALDAANGVARQLAGAGVSLAPTSFKIDDGHLVGFIERVEAFDVDVGP